MLAGIKRGVIWVTAIVGENCVAMYATHTEKHESIGVHSGTVRRSLFVLSAKESTRSISAKPATEHKDARSAWKNLVNMRLNEQPSSSMGGL